MPCSHFRGGLKSPTRQSRSGDGAPPLPCVDGFTLNGFPLNRFTVNGFIPPVDGLRHGRSRKPFRICSCEKCVRKCCGICSYKTKDLNFPGINTYKKSRGGAPPPCHSRHPQTVTLSNTGTATLNITSITLAGALSGDGGRC